MSIGTAVSNSPAAPHDFRSRLESVSRYSTPSQITGPSFLVLTQPRCLTDRRLLLSKAVPTSPSALSRRWTSSRCPHVPSLESARWLFLAFSSVRSHPKTATHPTAAIAQRSAALRRKPDFPYSYTSPQDKAAPEFPQTRATQAINADGAIPDRCSESNAISSKRLEALQAASVYRTFSELSGSKENITTIWR